jgi:hypothetical protein
MPMFDLAMTTRVQLEAIPNVSTHVVRLQNASTNAAIASSGSQPSSGEPPGVKKQEAESSAAGSGSSKARKSDPSKKPPPKARKSATKEARARAKWNNRDLGVDFSEIGVTIEPEECETTNFGFDTNYHDDFTENSFLTRMEVAMNHAKAMRNSTLNATFAAVVRPECTRDEWEEAEVRAALTKDGLFRVEILHHDHHKRAIALRRARKAAQTRKAREEAEEAEAAAIAEDKKRMWEGNIRCQPQ